MELEVAGSLAPTVLEPGHSAGSELTYTWLSTAATAASLVLC